MNVARFIATRAQKYLARLAVMAQVIDAAYEKTDSSKDRVRLSEVAELVAAKRDVEVSTPLRKDVVKAARLLGFTRITKTDNVPRYSFMRRRT